VWRHDVPQNIAVLCCSFLSEGNFELLFGFPTIRNFGNPFCQDMALCHWVNRSRPSEGSYVGPCSVRVCAFGHLEPAVVQCHSLKVPEPRRYAHLKFKFG
jgi:hypothetical protein